MQGIMLDHLRCQKGGFSEWTHTWNRQAIRKSTNVFVKVADWNQKGNQGRGEIRPSHGSEYRRLNQLLINRVDRIDAQLAEYNDKHPNQITTEVISGFLADKPLTRKDQGKGRTRIFPWQPL